MEQVRGDRNMKIITDKGLCEIYCGKWEGLNREEIQKKWPGMIDLWRLENTSVTTLDIDENGDFEILKWGDDSHLPDALKNPYVRIAGFVQKNFKAAYDMGEAEGKRHYEGFVLANGPHGMQGREPYIPVVAKPS